MRTFLVLLIALLWMRSAPANLEGRRTLSFLPIDAGLFSLFLQMKAAYALAKAVERDLVLVPRYISHYNTVLNICEIFELPAAITCRALPPRSKCNKGQKKTVVLELRSIATNVCADGVDILLIAGLFSPVKAYYKRPKEATLRATTVNIPFRLKPAIQAQIQRLKNDVLGGEEKGPYTVVHWRRGDQLTTRCTSGVDKSVNCKDASFLMLRISTSLGAQSNFEAKDRVYLATNEARDSNEMTILRLHGMHVIQDELWANFVRVGSSGTGTTGSISKPSSDAYRSQAVNSVRHGSSFSYLSFNPDKDMDMPDMKKYHMLHLHLLVEVSLMLEATVFLAWGVSGIDDLVQYERMMANKTHCIDQGQPSHRREMNWYGTPL